MKLTCDFTGEHVCRHAPSAMVIFIGMSELLLCGDHAIDGAVEITNMGGHLIWLGDSERVAV